MNAFTKVPHFQPLTRALLRASQRMITNEETPYTGSARALCLQRSSIGPDDLNHRQQGRHETREQAWPNLSGDEGTDQPGPVNSQGPRVLRGRTDWQA